MSNVQLTHASAGTSTRNERSFTLVTGSVVAGSPLTMQVARGVFNSVSVQSRITQPSRAACVTVTGIAVLPSVNPRRVASARPPGSKVRSVPGRRTAAVVSVWAQPAAGVVAPVLVVVVPLMVSTLAQSYHAIFTVPIAGRCDIRRAETEVSDGARANTGGVDETGSASATAPPRLPVFAPRPPAAADVSRAAATPRHRHRRRVQLPSRHRLQGRHSVRRRCPGCSRRRHRVRRRHRLLQCSLQSSMRNLPRRRRQLRQRAVLCRA